MIVVRAPLRISFVGGGTDLPDFFRHNTGRVLSATIDQFVYIVINRTPLKDVISAKYLTSETVDDPKKLKHTRIKAALLDMGIEKGIEIGSFSNLPAKTGLGSSSSFSVALMKGLHAYKGKKINKFTAAEEACRLEIKLLGEPIGKQDQYAASFGGINMIEFSPGGSVNVEPVLIGYQTRLALQNRLLVFFTGLKRDASSVLSSQKANISRKMDTLEGMADSVLEFRDRLLVDDFEGLGRMIDRSWQKKRGLAPGVSNRIVDEYYAAGMKAGSWGGKLLGAGAGGCMLFVVPPKSQGSVRAAVAKIAKANNLSEFREIPLKFVQSGTEILFNSDQGAP